MGETFNSSLYSRAPMISIASGIPLCRALAKECPKVAPANVKKARKRLVDAADAAQAAWAVRMKEEGAVSPADGRDVDQEADISWSAMRARIEAYAQLPASRHPLATRAGQLNHDLFGTGGLEFLRFKYPLQFATMDTILKRIHDEKLGDEIDTIAGPEFLAQVVHVHPRYQEMVHASMIRDDSSQENLVEYRRAMEGAIVNYTNKVVAMVEDDDPESIRIVTAALRPLVVYRENADSSRSQSAAPGEPAPADPVPASPTPAAELAAPVPPAAGETPAAKTATPAAAKTAAPAARSKKGAGKKGR